MRWNIGSWDARGTDGDLIARIKLLDYPSGSEYRVEWCGERHAPRVWTSMVQAMRNVEELDYRERERVLSEAEVVRRPDALSRAYDWLTGDHPSIVPPLSGKPVVHPPIVDTGTDWAEV